MSTTDDIQQVAAGFSQLGLYLRTQQWRAAKALDLTPTQIGILTFLKRRGPNKVLFLAKLLGVAQPTASRVIATLERKGLVEKNPDPGDGRATRISLTPAGGQLASDQPEFPEALLSALAGLDPLENTILHRVLSKIILELQEAGAIEPQRMCCTCRFFRPHLYPNAVKPHHCDFVDAPFGTTSLRLDCGDHVQAGKMLRKRRWRRFLAAEPLLGEPLRSRKRAGTLIQRTCHNPEKETEP